MTYLAPISAMTALPVPVQFVAAWIGTWIARHQERLRDSYFPSRANASTAWFHSANATFGGSSRSSSPTITASETIKGLENRLIAGAPVPANTNGRVVRKERLGGLLSFYHRSAA